MCGRLLGSASTPKRLVLSDRCMPLVWARGMRFGRRDIGQHWGRSVCRISRLGGVAWGALDAGYPMSLYTVGVVEGSMSEGGSQT